MLELLIYVSVLAILIIAASSVFFGVIKIKQKANAAQEVSDNIAFALEVMDREIRAAKKIYLPWSVFDSGPGQLSLETTNYLPPQEETTYLDFYVCQEQLCFKQEGQDQLVLTSDKVKVQTLKFSRVVTGQKESVEILLEISFNNTNNRPENQASATLTSVASLRSY